MEGGNQVLVVEQVERIQIKRLTMQKGGAWPADSDIEEPSHVGRNK
jgi:hypothetical protein